VKVGSLSRDQLHSHLADGTLSIQTGPFSLALRSPLRSLTSDLRALYADHECALAPEFSDFHTAVEPAPGLRGLIKRQVRYTLDGQGNFPNFPGEQALPLMEWGHNWCIANHGHGYMVLHAASLERDGRAIIMPGPPGSGKSTLCAALSLKGWRLLSDELTLVSLIDGSLAALARPVSLKNESIALIKKRAPSGVFSTSIVNTQKGTIALMKAPGDSATRVHEPASPAWVVFPRYEAESQTRLTERPKEETAIELARNAFNYSLYGRRGFELLVVLIDSVSCHDIIFSDIDDAVEQVSGLQ
jgi:hypothetical protein